MLSVQQTLHRIVFVEKLNNAPGFITLFLLSAAIAVVVAQFGLVGGVLTIAAIVGLPTVYCIIAFPRFGIIVYLTLAYLIMWFLKIGVSFPLGTLMDGMLALFLLSLFISQKKSGKDWSLFYSPVTLMMLIWIIYNFLEVINPDAASRSAWMFTVRSIALVMFSYFIFLYYIDSKNYLRLLCKLWIGLATFAALYGLKQEFIGFFPFEEAYLHSDPGIELLLFIGGVWRKFSIFSDPVAFSYNMATASLLCIGLYSGTTSKSKRIGL
ncbi:MAG: O-antigen ligase domain-containing protein, partial [Chitinophagia bacterium]|nr:O-antigen ligase domain-containing protein [Chitinophagia bacterium]